MKEPKLPKRVLKVIERCRRGEVLCKTLIHGRNGEDVVIFVYHPSNKSAPIMSSFEAIQSGLLVPQNDGLFGSDTSQTWRAA